MRQPHPDEQQPGHRYTTGTLSFSRQLQLHDPSRLVWSMNTGWWWWG